MNSRFKNGMDPMNRSKGKVSPKTSRKPASMQKKTVAKKATFTHQPRRYPRVDNAPVSIGVRNVSSDPKFLRTSKDRVLISHRELFTSLNGSATFGIAPNGGIPINPGLAGTFAWLSTQAVGWERYRFRRLALRYVPRCGSNNPGAVTFAADYDATDAPPSSEQQIASYRGATECSVWQECLFEFDVKALSVERFIRAAVPLGIQDIRLYDACNLFIGTVDGSNSAPATLSWGKIWLEYDVELITQQYNPAPVQAITFDCTPAAGISGSSLLGSTAFTTTTVLSTGNPVGVQILGNAPQYSYSTGGNAITFFSIPLGTEIVATLAQQCTTSFTGISTVSATGGVSSLFNGSPTVGGVSIVYYSRSRVTTNGANVTLSFTTSSISGGTYSNCILTVTFLLNGTVLTL
jgi:hypothetical protein